MSDGNESNDAQPLAGNTYTVVVSDGKVSEDARDTRVGHAYAVVHSCKHGLLFIEELPDAVEKNYRSFAAVAGEDWQIIGIFEDIEAAYKASCAWVQTPGSKRRSELAAE